MKTFNLLAASAGIAAALALPASAQESDYPSETVTILVGFSAGGATDVLARALADGLSDKLGGTFVVENRAGAGGSVAATALAQAKPDGHTLMVTAGSAMTINVHIPPEENYDPLTDFTFISQLVANDGVLVVPNESEIKNWDDFIAYAKEHPGELSYGISGLGSPTHMGMERLKQKLGIDIFNVPYQGDAAVAVGVISGSQPLGIMAIPSVVGQLEGKQMRPIAVFGSATYDSLPGVPSIGDLGYPDETIQTWLGLIGPAGMPEDVVETLTDATLEIMASERMTELMGTLNSRIVASTPAEFADYVSKEFGRWGEAVRDLGLDKQ